MGRSDTNRDCDTVFAGSIPELYDRLLVPLRNEIESRGGATMAEATAAGAAAMEARFGSGAVDGKIQARVVSVRA
jgi:hypothetical protein